MNKEESHRISGSGVLFTDMDGTLLLDDSSISEYMKQTLDRLTAAGHRLVLTSGRPLDSILEVMEVCGLFYPNTLLIANNGSLIYDCSSHSPLRELTLTMEQAAQIMKAAEDRGIHAQTYTDHEIVCRRDDEEAAYYRRRIHMPLLTVPDPLAVLSHPPYKVQTIHLTDRRALEALKTAVEQLCGSAVTAQFSNDRYLEFYNSLAGKGSAIRWVCEYFHILPENSMAAGDAPNDISMLTAAGIGVAMANADPSVKKAADFITSADNNRNGLAEAIEHFFF